MIIRIFRAEVRPGHLDEFSRKFQEISTPLVEKQPGLISVVTGQPTAVSDHEFVMISTWESEEALRAFAGENWTQPVIPPGMEEHMVRSWVHHYEG